MLKKRGVTTPTKTLRAFISYSAKDKLRGAEVKQTLKDLGVESFLAHDDLRISEEWKHRILEEIEKCKIFVPLLSRRFRSSDWASQETGIAAYLSDVLIIPVLLDGTKPYGFIAHLQGKRISVTGISSEMFQDAIVDHFPRQVIPVLIKRVENARSFRSAEAVVQPLINIFPHFNRTEANKFAVAAIKNRQVWSADLCRKEYLPKFLKMHGNRINQKFSKALRHQIRYNREYRTK